MCFHVFFFRNKGVKVELGIPYELWDKPSAEVSKMHRAVSDWKFTLHDFLFQCDM
jgi:hypothetical protein